MLRGVSCCPLFVDANCSSNVFRVLFTCSRSSLADPVTDLRFRLRTLMDVPFASDRVSSRRFQAFRCFFSLTWSPVNAFSALLAALAALRSFFTLLRSLRSSFVSVLSSDFRFLLLFVSPTVSSTCSGTGVDVAEDDGTEWDGLGLSSGPNTGPLKNRAYRPRFAASLLAVARSDRRAVASTWRLGVVLPEVEAGVPETGRRLEMMPVVVRRRGADVGSTSEGSWGNVELTKGRL